MKQKFEVEFYYLPKDRDHCQILNVIREALHAIAVNAVIQFRIVDMQSGSVISPANLPGIPCLRRTLPKPEQLILASSITRDQVFTVLGLPRTLIAENQDQFSSWTGPMS